MSADLSVWMLPAAKDATAIATLRTHMRGVCVCHLLAPIMPAGASRADLVALCRQVVGAIAAQRYRTTAREKRRMEARKPAAARGVAPGGGGTAKTGAPESGHWTGPVEIPPAPRHTSSLPADLRRAVAPARSRSSDHRTMEARDGAGAASGAAPAGRLRCLDLFCCAGGVARGLAAAGFEVVGVDIAPQPRYPFEFHQADALSYTLAGFDAVWASPPCQAHSSATPDDRKKGHVDLIPATRARLEAWGGPWIMENVAGARAALRSPVMLCGTMFGLRVLRHRLFESNLLILQPTHEPHRGTVTAGDYVCNVGNGVASWTLKAREARGLPRHFPGEARKRTRLAAMGLPAEAEFTRWELAQAIPPAYSQYLGGFLRRAVEAHR